MSETAEITPVVENNQIPKYMVVHTSHGYDDETHSRLGGVYLFTTLEKAKEWVQARYEEDFLEHYTSKVRDEVDLEDSVDIESTVEELKEYWRGTLLEFLVFSAWSFEKENLFTDKVVNIYSKSLIEYLAANTEELKNVSITEAKSNNYDYYQVNLSFLTRERYKELLELHKDEFNEYVENIESGYEEDYEEFKISEVTVQA